MKAAVALLCCSLAGCAGISTYDIHPYYEQATGQEVCCAVRVTSGRDVASATIDVTKAADGTITAHYTESGVVATAPIAANAQTASSVSAAVTAAAITAGKFAK